MEHTQHAGEGHGHGGHGGHEDHDEHDEHDAHGHTEDWNDEEFVASWIERQKERAPERRRQFVIIRSVIPKTREQEFRYLNLGAGPGHLDEVLLEQFPGATATLVDGSVAMLGAARQQLERFGERVEYVQANLSHAAWAGAVSGPFDFAVSTTALHNLRDPRRIRELYAETHRLLGHGGMLLNLDYVRPAHRTLAALGPWAAKDAEAGFTGRGGGAGTPATMTEQLGWLSEAGFGTVDVLWKELGTALICGIRDHIHIPEGEGGHGDGGHGHGHGH